jgi:hypothetical protein
MHIKGKADQSPNTSGCTRSTDLKPPHSHLPVAIIEQDQGDNEIHARLPMSKFVLYCDGSRARRPIRFLRQLPGLQAVIPDQLLQFVRRHIKSVWTLDLLVLMQREARRAWTLEALARELRGNQSLVQNALSALAGAGLLQQEGGGAYRYAPASTELEAIAAELARHYAERPVALIKEIASAPNEKIQSFADAFRIKKD